MTREEWITMLKKKFSYDIYYFSGGMLDHIISNPKSYDFEINRCNEYSTFISIALLEK